MHDKSFGYENYWKYIDEFKLPVLPYFHRENRLALPDNKWYSAEQVNAMRVGQMKNRVDRSGMNS